MRYIKLYEELDDIKTYFLTKDGTISEFLSTYKLTKEITYAKTKVLYYIKDNKIEEPNPFMTQLPEMPIKMLLKKIEYQSNNLQDVIDYVEMMNNTKKYNL